MGVLFQELLELHLEEEVRVLLVPVMGQVEPQTQVVAVEVLEQAEQQVRLAALAAPVSSSSKSHRHTMPHSHLA